MCSLLLGQQDPPYVHMLDACIGFLGLGKLLYSTTGVAIANLQETKDRQQDRQAQEGDQKRIAVRVGHNLCC